MSRRMKERVKYFKHSPHDSARNMCNKSRSKNIRNLLQNINSFATESDFYYKTFVNCYLKTSILSLSPFGFPFAAHLPMCNY